MADSVIMRHRELLQQLTERLWEERHVVTYLLFKLTLVKLFLGADATRLVAETLQEVDETIAQLRQLESVRADALHALAEAWHSPVDVLTLRQLSERAPPPFDAMFADHAQAFAELAGEIDDVTGENRALAKSRLTDVASALDVLSGNTSIPTATYDARGSVDVAAPPVARLRKVL